MYAAVASSVEPRIWTILVNLVQSKNPFQIPVMIVIPGGDPESIKRMGPAKAVKTISRGDAGNAEGESRFWNLVPGP